MAAPNSAATCGVDASANVRRTPIRAPRNLQQISFATHQVPDEDAQPSPTLKYVAEMHVAMMLTVPTRLSA
jgi:hypothetical protein